MKQHGTIRLLAAAFALFLAAVLLPLGTSQADSEIEIANYEQLKAFAARVNDGESNLNAKLTDDITCTDKTWTPIGDAIAYQGTFDGQGHTITGLSNADVDYSGLSAEDRVYIGLFGCVYTGKVQNVTVAGCDFSITSDAEHLTVHIGAIVGYNSSGTVVNCRNVGSLSTTLAISNDCIEYIGGGVGYNYKGTVVNCVNTGAVSVGMGTDIGGVVGYNSGTVKTCLNTGSISGGRSSQVGGIVGLNTRDRTVEDCLNTGTVLGGDFAYVGGVDGYNAYGNVKNCLSVGAVSGGINSGVGGAVGSCPNNASVTSYVENCYYLNTAASAAIGSVGTATVTNVSALTANELQSLSNCVGFSTDTWYEGLSYPVLKDFSGEVHLYANSNEDVVLQRFICAYVPTAFSNPFTYANHEFTGWNTQADGEGDPYDETHAFTLLPGETLSLSAQWEVTYPLWVGGRQVTDANKNDILGDNSGSVRFRVENGNYILTLDNADISTYSTHDVQWWRRTANIFFNQLNINLTIELIGDNTLSGAEGGVVFVPTDSSGVVTLTGGGTLSIDGSYFDVYGFGTLYIDGTTLTVGKEAGGNTGAGLYARGITIDGSSVQAYGLYYAVMAETRGLSITDSRVFAKGDVEGVDVNGPITIGGDSTLIAEASAEEGAVRVYGDVTLNDGVELVVPENADYVQVGGGGYCVANPDGSRATRAVYAKPYSLWIGGEQVTSANLSGEGWAFTPASNGNAAILELNNYSYSGEGVFAELNGNPTRTGILYMDETAPLLVYVTGENTITETAEGDYFQVAGLYARNEAENALTIVGTDEDAVLTVKSGTAEAVSAAIASKGGMTIRNLKVNAESLGCDNYSYGLYVNKGITLDNCDCSLKSGTAAYGSYTIYAKGGVITLNGGKVNAEAADSEYSIAVFGTNDGVRINQCEVVAQAGEGSEYGYGVYTNSGNIEIADSTVQCTTKECAATSDAIYTGGSISIERCTVTAIGGGGDYSFGVVAFYGSISILDSEVYAEGGAAETQSGGINAYTDITIGGNSTVKAIGADTTGEYGASTGIISYANLTINGSSVEAIAGAGFESYGVCAFDWIDGTGSGRLTVTDGSLITTGSETEGYGIYTSTLNVGGDSKVTAQGGYAIGADGGIVLTDDIAIVEPFNSGMAQNENGMPVVSEADGETPAKKAVLKKAATVTFVNEDGTVLQSGKVAIGDLPVYYGETPTKEPTQRYTYTFADWTPAFVPVEGEATYTASYTEELLRPLFIADRAIAYDAWIRENDEILYRFDIRVTDLLDGAVSIGGAQIFLEYDSDAIEFRRGEGPVDWLISDAEGRLFAAWASDTEVALENGDTILTLYFAKKNVAPNTEVEITFTENALGSGSSLSLIEEGEMLELTARTEDGSIRFGEILIGDANCDGMITSADAAQILRAIVGLSEITPRGALNADVDGDGEVAAADAVMILRYLVGLIDSFPAEP